MSQLIDNLNLIVSIKSDIKSAIENKGVDMTGVSFPGYASKIGEISGGGGVDPSGTLDISENGVYDVYSYASASVDVHPSASLSETYTSNGSYDITGEFNGGVITVDVPSPQFVTETLNVSANGTYTPGQGVDGYSQVVVDVPAPGWDQKSFTEGNIEIINLDNSASFVASSAFNGNTTIKTVNLPYATSVGDYAFFQCKALTQVSLPVCKSIGKSAFAYCQNLNQVSLPVCSYLNNRVFHYCNFLRQVSLPVCSYIGDRVFDTCMRLSRITIGYSGVCSLNNSNAFDNTQITSSTGSIYVPTSLVDAYKSASNWSYFSTQIFPIIEPSLSFDSTTGLLSGNCSVLISSVEINSFLSDNNIDRASITQISLPYLTYFAGFETFAGCSNLISVSLPVCDDIGAQTFESCTSLSDIYIPNCKTVGAAAFRNCEMLQNISLPVCDYIGLSAFSNTKLDSIVLGSTSVCSLNNINALGNTPIASGTGSIYVPASLVNVYKSAKNWSVYSSRIFPIE